MATDRKAEVTWQGDLMSGNGRIDSGTSGAVGRCVMRAADGAKQNCPESKALTGVPEISLTARLES
jgi:hypothetical protein